MAIRPEILAQMNSVPKRKWESISPVVRAHQKAANARQIEATANLKAQGAERKANRDPLTGLLNKGGYDEAVKEEQSYVDNKSSKGGVIIALDMTRLKAVNDVHGHAGGDAAIIAFSNALKNNLRDSDVVARVGGDEFLVVLRNATIQETEERIVKLNVCLRDIQFEFKGKKLSVGARLGIATYDGDFSLHDAKELADKREAFVRDHLMPSSHSRATRQP
jgi:diguanylate cyclase (GGDEF)-like protein